MRKELLCYQDSVLTQCQSRCLRSLLCVQVKHIAYWDYNANSGDTGGIVDDSWVNVLWVKINWLIATMDLKPWYLGTVSLSASALQPGFHSNSLSSL